MRRLALAFLLLAPALTAGARADSIDVDALRSVLAARIPQIGAVGGEVSLLADRDSELAAALSLRPSTTGLATVRLGQDRLAAAFPPPTVAGPLADTNLDGLPDRVERALEAARRTLARLDAAGLPRPADDGDGELDLYLLPLGSVARGWVGLEPSSSAERGAAGFIVLNIAHPGADEALAAMTARLVARLALLGIDREAPSWWLEPSVAWFELQVAGPSLELASAVRSRWSRPELGLQTGLAKVARGNVELLLALEDTGRAERTLRDTWSALARRREVDPRDPILLEALTRASGWDIPGLEARAAVRAIVDGLEPTRWAADVGEIPAGGIQVTLHAGPWGGGLVALRPDPLRPGGTRLAVRSDGSDWHLSLIARRRDGRWERIFGRAEGPRFELLIPWADYDRAVAVLVRDGYPGRREAELLFDDAGGESLFALASVSARRLADGAVEIAWRTGWERDLFGWLIERADGPDGPWTPVGELPAPALGRPDAGAHYRLHDRAVPDDEQPAYRIVAVTRDGLRVSGPVVIPSR